MLVALMYVATGGVVAVAIYSLHRNARSLRAEGMSAWLSALNSTLQVVVVSLGILVAVETLKVSTSASAFPRQINTNRLLEEYAQRDISRQTREYKWALLNAYSALVSAGADRSTAARLSHIQAVADRTDLDGDISGYTDFVDQLVACGRTEECTRSRIRKIMCANLTGIGAVYDPVPVVDIDDSRTAQNLSDLRHTLYRTHQFACPIHQRLFTGIVESVAKRTAMAD